MNTLEARLEVLSAALAAMAATLPPEQAARAAQALRELVAGVQMAPEADEAVGVDLAPLLRALGR